MTRFFAILASFAICQSASAQFLVGLGSGPVPNPVRTQGNHPAPLSLATIPPALPPATIQRNPVIFANASTFGGAVPFFPPVVQQNPIVVIPVAVPASILPTPTPVEGSAEFRQAVPPTLPRATLIVNAPVGLEVWIDGRRFGRSGGSHVATSPGIPAGQRHEFQLKLVAPSGDTEEELIPVEAGQDRSITLFRLPAPKR